MPLDRTAFDDLLAWHRIDALLAYVRFLAINARDFKQAEVFAKTLPWATPDVLRTKDRRVFALMSLIQVLNGTGRHAEACEALKMLESVSGEQSSDPTYYMHKAIAASWSAEQLEAENSFAVALVLDSVLNGPWHNQTLHTTTQIGRALRAWHSHVPALAFLTLSCQALYYVLGLSHPLSIQAFKELQACKSAEPAMQRLRQFSHSQFSHKRKQSMAFEQVHLTTAIELLSHNLRINFDEITASLEQLLTTTTLTGKATFGAKRIIAWCAMEQNRFREASDVLHNLHSSITDIKCDAVSTEVYRAILALDEAICFSRTRPHPGLKFTRQRSKLVYLVLNGIPPERSHQAKAILRRLTSYGLTHFTREEVFQAPPLITETNRESLGSGSSATVDTVQIRERLYARKSINYPRQVQREIRLKEDIQKEIKITYALDHPHIVRVLLTYEETKRFNIIMHPLADCDLESYLADKTCDSAQQKSLICKWIACLTNTLAYIHSKNIRHKDIKPRNVLVKGTKVYFTDFGSGHMFSDDGNSTTDGIAYGHTRAYCAPEVIQNADRNRASDVFSLGCILAEMAAWGSGISMSDYFSGIRVGENATDTVQYHNSTVRVRSWFEREPRLTQGAKGLFHNVVRHMIRKKPDSRLTAVEVSRVLGAEVSSYTSCIKCGIDVWVPDQ
ncbi:hypothetical protein E8E13_000815 [Curvularia kusanoi]|uniref:Protein kinase domain-containing protein n=1 Tax=Curvularia kusanoi TaxID=90978 RepID=A0A9P4THD4_CURKU|nr:hypothetical protein E8E13_000815 [Curvularia kusanoi]